ncbi:MAG TPA: Lsr2 family protein [Jatrophihabitans sp.]|nr:Lsr2 family protein [Jatrophihabitans sp.]
MATRTTLIIYDDLDGSEGADRVTFAYAGTSYEIDLGKKNQAALEKALAKYIAAARKTGRRPAQGGRRSSNATAGRGQDLAAIRAWAREQGLEVSVHGRVSKDVQRAYEAAH